MRGINKHDRMMIDECGLLSGVTIIGMGGALAWKSNREKKVSRESSCESEIHQQDHINHEEEISKSWLQKVLNHLWSHLYLACWKLRNHTDLHDGSTRRIENRNAKLKPAIVALYKTAEKLDYLDTRLFTLPLVDRPTQKSSETAWINVVTLTANRPTSQFHIRLA
jgi:hypothetical protein